jgi:hypothetical protein
MNLAGRLIRMVSPRQFRLRGALLACGLIALLTGCTSFSLNSLIDIMPSAVGLPADAPERPVAPPNYPAVHDMPPPRSNSTLSAEEQVKLEEDLVAVRTRQEVIAGTAPATAKKRRPPAPAEPRVIPTASSNSIY